MRRDSGSKISHNTVVAYRTASILCLPCFRQIWKPAVSSGARIYESNVLILYSVHELDAEVGAGNEIGGHCSFAIVVTAAAAVEGWGRGERCFYLEPSADAVPTRRTVLDIGSDFGTFFSARCVSL